VVEEEDEEEEGGGDGSPGAGGGAEEADAAAGDDPFGPGGGGAREGVDACGESLVGFVAHECPCFFEIQTGSHRGHREHRGGVGERVFSSSVFSVSSVRNGFFVQKKFNDSVFGWGFEEDGAGAEDVGGGREDGDDDGGPDGDVTDEADPLHIAADGEVDEDGADGEGLGEHFDFAGPVGAEVDALGFGEAADGGDEEFAADEDDGHPGVDAGGVGVLEGGDGDEVVGGEEDESAADEDFVDEGVDNAAEGGFDFPFAGEVAVEDVGEGGDEETGEGEPHLPGEGVGVVDVEEEEEDDGEEEAGDGDEVGDVAIHVRPIGKTGRRLRETHRGRLWTGVDGITTEFVRGALARKGLFQSEGDATCFNRLLKVECKVGFRNCFTWPKARKPGQILRMAARSRGSKVRMEAGWKWRMPA
jgi:hypothetical protein